MTIYTPVLPLNAGNAGSASRILLIARRCPDRNAHVHREWESWLLRELVGHWNYAIRFCAVTFTCKQALPLRSGGVERLTHAKLSKAIGVFLKHLQCDVYGKAYSRHGRRLAVIPVIEEGAKGRLHVHMLLEMPDPERSKLSGEAFEKHVARLWRDLQWARKEARIDRLESCSDARRFTSYILKDMRRNDAALDVLNLYF
jgi:hypothetical protein